MNWNPALLSEVQQVDSQMGSQLSGSPRNSTKPPIRLGSDFVRENPTIFFPKNDIFMTIFHDIPLFEDVFSLQNKIFAKKGNLSKKNKHLGSSGLFSSWRSGTWACVSLAKDGLLGMS